MRILKYAILGLINREPMTGYDIAREFNSQNLANFWYAKHSQIYPELSRLMEEGLVTYQVVIQGEKLEKKLYTITEKGRQELKEWLIEKDPLPPTAKDVFRLRMYFSESMSREQLRSHLMDQLEKHSVKCRHLSDMMEKNHNNTPPPPGTRECGDYMVLKGGIMRETTYLQWLKDCLALLDS